MCAVNLKHIHINKGLIIIVEYGYIKPINNFTLQTVSRHKKTHIFENIGLQDITSRYIKGIPNR